MHRCLRCVVAFTLVLGFARAHAAAQETAAEPGSELTVYLATYGPGDAEWEKFGHNAIWIRDRTTFSTVSYNYGMFDMQAEGFYPRFLRGRMLYHMGVFDADAEAAAYAARNRTVQVQRLNLLPAQRITLRNFLELNWARDSGAYLYDYFRDNCSTRIRDALDGALGGVIRAALADSLTPTTFRSHSLRLTGSNPATYTGLVLGLGLPTDRPITAWEETFIPMRLMHHLRGIRVAGPDGRELPLVAEEITQFVSSRTPPPDEPPARTLWYLLIGLALGGGLVLLSRFARSRPAARLAAALAISFWGVATGLFGLILALLWLFTDHTAAYPNLNLLLVNPLAFLLAVAAPLALAGTAGGRWHRTARLAWPTAIALAALAVAGLLLQAVPALRQMNGPLLALVLPIHFAVVWTLYRGGGAGPSLAEDNRARISLRNAA